MEVDDVADNEIRREAANITAHHGQSLGPGDVDGGRIVPRDDLPDLAQRHLIPIRVPLRPDMAAVSIDLMLPERGDIDNCRPERGGDGCFEQRPRCQRPRCAQIEDERARVLGNHLGGIRDEATKDGGRGAIQAQEPLERGAGRLGIEGRTVVKRHPFAQAKGPDVGIRIRELRLGQAWFVDVGAAWPKADETLERPLQGHPRAGVIGGMGIEIGWRAIRDQREGR